MNWKFWQPECAHKYSMWEVTRITSNNNGEAVYRQVRRCSVCGFTQVNVQRVG